MADKNDKNFKPGEIVQLASGGPPMTVIGEGTLAGYLFCQWFDAKNDLKGNQFLPDSLVRVDQGYS